MRKMGTGGLRCHSLSGKSRRGKDVMFLFECAQPETPIGGRSLLWSGGEVWAGEELGSSACWEVEQWAGRTPRGQC